MPDRLHAIVRGTVQGVGFRDFVRRRAERLGLTGTVRNRADGTVEVVAEGDRPDLESLLRELQAGTPLAAVDTVDAHWQAASGDLPSFRVA